MITSRALVEHVSLTMRLIENDVDEYHPCRSIVTKCRLHHDRAGRVQSLTIENYCDQIDLNFDSPVFKVTGKGAATALP